MNYPFLLAGGASAFALVLHILVGRARSILPPRPETGRDRLLDSDAWYGRYLTMLMLAAMTLGYGDAARRADAKDVAMALTALAWLMVLLRIGLAVRARSLRLDVGEWGFIALAGLLGEVGLLV